MPKFPVDAAGFYHCDFPGCPFTVHKDINRVDKSFYHHRDIHDQVKCHVCHKFHMRKYIKYHVLRCAKNHENEMVGQDDEGHANADDREDDAGPSARFFAPALVEVYADGSEISVDSRPYLFNAGDPSTAAPVGRRTDGYFLRGNVNSSGDDARSSGGFRTTDHLQRDQTCCVNEGHVPGPGTSPNSPCLLNAGGSSTAAPVNRDSGTTDLSLGDIVYLNGEEQRRGRVCFIGEVSFLKGRVIGLWLDQKNGKHDGALHGQRYFTCPDGHGVFTRPSRVFRDPASTPLETAADRVENSELRINVHQDVENDLDLKLVNDELRGEVCRLTSELAALKDSRPTVEIRDTADIAIQVEAQEEGAPRLYYHVDRLNEALRSNRDKVKALETDSQRNDSQIESLKLRLSEMASTLEAERSKLKEQKQQLTLDKIALEDKITHLKQQINDGVHETSLVVSTRSPSAHPKTSSRVPGKGKRGMSSIEAIDLEVDSHQRFGCLESDSRVKSPFCSNAVEEERNSEVIILEGELQKASNAAYNWRTRYNELEKQMDELKMSFEVERESRENLEARVVRTDEVIHEHSTLLHALTRHVKPLPLEKVARHSTLTNFWQKEPIALPYVRVGSEPKCIRPIIIDVANVGRFSAQSEEELPPVDWALVLKSVEFFKAHGLFDILLIVHIRFLPGNKIDAGLTADELKAPSPFYRHGALYPKLMRYIWPVSNYSSDNTAILTLAISRFGLVVSRDSFLDYVSHLQSPRWLPEFLQESVISFRFEMRSGVLQFVPCKYGSNSEELRFFLPAAVVDRNRVKYFREANIER